MPPSASTTPANIALADGTTMPQLGYGVWQVPEEQVAGTVEAAIAAGYRSIDTATVYENEAGVGAGIRASGITRDELFVTTKLWNTDHDAVDAALDASLERLGLEHVELYLIHWPSPTRDRYVQAWRSLVDSRASGRARSIGVANFEIAHLERIADVTGVLPVVDQVELHPYFPQAELRAWHAAHGVVTESWSPLGQGGELLAEPVLAEIARRRGCTPAQVVLAWHLALGVVTIPKSVTPARIVENFASLDVTLDADDLAAIATLDRGAAGRIGPDPSTAAF